MLSSASCGMPVGYSAILLPQLKITNDTMHIDEEIGSWIGKKFIILIIVLFIKNHLTFKSVCRCGSTVN